MQEYYNTGWKNMWRIEVGLTRGVQRFLDAASAANPAHAALWLKDLFIDYVFPGSKAL